MRRFALFALLAMCIPAHAIAQVAGHIGIYGDPLATSCQIEDLYPHTIQAYVVHALSDRAAGSQFEIAASEGFTGVFLGDIEADGALKFGSAPTGVQIGYGGCFQGLKHILTVTYHLDGRSGGCSFLEVRATDVNPNSPGLLMVDCDYHVHEAEGGRAYVNGNGSCQCFAAGAATPTRQTTWGGIKELYAGI